MLETRSVGGEHERPGTLDHDVAGSAKRHPGFRRHAVSVQTLIDYLEAGDPLEAFLADFPSVSREHAVAVLEFAKSALLAKAVAAWQLGGPQDADPPRCLCSEEASRQPLRPRSPDCPGDGLG